MAGEAFAGAKPLHLPATASNAPTDWDWLRLDDACEGVFDCPHSTPTLTDSGPLVVRSQDMITGVLRTEEAAHVSEATYRERTAKAIPARGDLLYSREGTYFGIAAEVPPDTPLCLGQRMVLLRPKSGVLDFRFLRYWLNSPIMASHIHGYRDGSVAERLNLPTIRALPVAVPPLQEQRAIAHFLDTLDDKIALNRRMNETLEAMARALFKSWFVDFDPVRAKAEGREPGLLKPVAELFPDSFEDSELGEIPRGWGTHPLGDLLSLDKGLSYKGEFLTEHGVPMVNLGCFLGRGRFADKAIKRYSGEYKPRHVVYPLDLVLANTDITQQREVIGSPALIPPRGDLSESELIFSHHVFAARFHQGREFWKTFVYFMLLQDDFRARAAGFATGTTVLALPRDAVLNVRFPGAPKALVTAFAEMTMPILEREWKSDDESRTLATLRDTLLPKLISGELRVTDAEKFIGGRV